MNDQELKQLWQHCPLPEQRLVSGVELVQTLKDRVRKLDRNLFWRDLREIAACLVVMAWFIPACFQSASLLTRVGNLVVVGSCLVIGGEILVTRRAARADLSADSMRAFLVGEIAKVGRQVRLLQTVLWWYILPILGGVALVELGKPVDWTEKIAVLVAFVPFGWFLHWINQRAVQHYLLPIKTDLESALQSAPEFLESARSNPSEESSL